MRAGSRTDTPREGLRKHQESASGSTFQLSPREATGWLRQHSRFSLLLSALLCSVEKSRVRPGCCTECSTVCLSLLCLPLRSRSHHNAQHFTSNWGQRERAPALLISMEIVYVRTLKPENCFNRALRAVQKIAQRLHYTRYI